MDCLKHILEGIGGMCIIHDSCNAFLGTDWFQTTTDTFQCTHYQEDVLGFLAKHNSSTIYGKQVADIELSDELHSHLMAVDVEIHALKMTLYDLRLEVGKCSCRICFYGSLCVLHHDHSVLVIGIGYGESRLRQTIEERLLGIAIVLECLVIVEMVTREVGKQASSEFKSADTLLCYGMTRALHEGILTSCLHHPGKQAVKLYRIRSGMVGWYCLVLDIIANR